MVKYLKVYGQKDENLQSPDLKYRLHFLPKKDIQIVKPQYAHNHFSQNFHLGNKKALYYNMKQYYELNNQYIFDFLPLTFHICKGIEDTNWPKFLQAFREVGGNKKKWIVKPGENTNRGTGIKVCEGIGEIRKVLESKSKHLNGSEISYIVQLYIDRPLLYYKRKFDIRCYMLLTCQNGILRAYWYQEGYIRTSSKEFSLQNCSDPLVHLTNDAIQKFGDDYGRYETGNKVSFIDFQKFLDAYHHEAKINFNKDLYQQLKNISTDTVKATFMKLDVDKRDYSFEIFGLDFMIDDSFKPWLIEVNTNPDITTNTPVCLRIIPNMVENALRIGLDPLFPPPVTWPAQRRHLVPDKVQESNKFELIFDEVQDGPLIRILYKDQHNILEGINEIEEEEEELKSDDENPSSPSKSPLKTPIKVIKH